MFQLQKNSQYEYFEFNRTFNSNFDFLHTFERYSCASVLSISRILSKHHLARADIGYKMDADF